jgi:hypothetical protein
MIPYTRFLPDVLPYAPDCPELVAIQQLRSATIEFCERTDYVRYDHPAIDVVGGVGAYTLTAPAETTVSRVLDGYHSGRRITAISEDTLAAHYSQNWSEQEGRPIYFFLTEPGNVTIVPKPQTSQDDALRFVVALRPSRDSSTCHDILFERFAEVISAGARSRLYEMNGQPFYDPQAHLYYRARFVSGVGAARAERNRSHGRAILIARPMWRNL